MQWIASRQRDGMLKAGGYANLYTTAVVLRAINPDAPRDAATLALAQSLAGALLARQGASGDWGGSTMLTAIVFEAVHPYTASTPQLAGRVQASLLAAQQANGSWADDPYTTALALRALVLVGVKPVDPGQQANSGSVRGTVLDAESQAPLENATVAVQPAAGGAPITAQTDAQGRYDIVVSPVGEVGVSAAKAGYSLVSGSGVVPRQGVLSFSPALQRSITVSPPLQPDPSVTTASVAGKVTKASNGDALAGVAITASSRASGQSLTATTDALGIFSIEGIAAGSVTISAQKAGWITASGLAELPAGARGMFSPALMEAGSPAATSVPVSGQVVDGVTKTPLPGVDIAISGPAGQAAATTGVDGRFSMAAPIGAITLEYTKSGYLPVTRQATTVSGSRLDAGVVELAAVRQSSTLHGRVTGTTGQAIAGATVAIGDKAAATNAAGAYVLQDIPGTRWTVEVSASGYQGRSFEVAVAQPGDVTQDFVLPTRQEEGFLDLAGLGARPVSAGLNQKILASVRVRNASRAQAASSLALEVQAADGTVIAVLPPLDAAGLPMGDAQLQPGDEVQAHFEWSTASHAAGDYALVARLIVPGSRHKDDPTGVVTASLRASASIVPQPWFSGSAAAEPPVVQAGAGTPVALTALVRNSGNVVLPAGAYSLRVIDSTTKQVLHEATAQAPTLMLNAMHSLDFGSWTPEQSASLRVEITSGLAPGAVVASGLYVGDMARAIFTVDKAVVPPGDQSARGAVRITGLDMASGSSTDPLAPMIREAVTKAVRYGDEFAYVHHVSDLRCFACHVQTQALAGGEKNLRFAQPLDPNKRNEMLNAVLQSMDANGAVQGAGRTRTPTLLALWATKEWHRPQEIASSNRKLAQALIAMAYNGQWTADYGGHWWGSTGQATAVNTASLVDYARLLSRHGPGFVQSSEPFAVRNLASGEKRLAAAPDGTLYVGNRADGSVMRIAPGSGEAIAVASGLPLNNIRYTASAKLLIATGNGLYLSDGTAAPIRLSEEPASDAIELAAGGYLLRSPNRAVVHLLAPDGSLSERIRNPALGTGGGQLEEAADGAILATVPGQQRILRFEASGELRDVPAAYTNGVPYQMSRYGKRGHLLSTSQGLYWYNDNWVVERLSFDPLETAVAMPDDVLVLGRGNALSRMRFAPADGQAMAASLAVTIGQAADRLRDGAIFNADNNIDVALRLNGLARLREHYQGTARAGEFDSLIDDLARTLWSRQRSDGGWEVRNGWHSRSDPLVTAIVGVALDHTHPSRDDPRLRKAIGYVLAAQNADGSWVSTNGLGGKLLSSTWIEIWLPTLLDRLGALDADLSLSFAPDVVPSGFTLPPARTEPQADGSTRYLWSFTGVTQDGRDLFFDLALRDMAIDEVRPAAQQASLQFRNSFVPGEEVSMPLVVPRVAANANLSLTARTDRPVYADQETARFEAPVANGGLQTREAQVRFTVLDRAQNTVAVLARPPAAMVDAGQTRTVDSLWRINGVLAGDYELLAELVSPAGVVYGSARAPFKVIGGAGFGNATRISADRQEYRIGQPVHITSMAGNTSANVVQENLRARTTVVRAGSGAVADLDRTETIAQLSPAGTREFAYAVPGGQLEPATYQARLQLMDPAGALLSESRASFLVKGMATGCLAGVSGVLAAAPSTVPVGGNARFELQLYNPGTQPLRNGAVVLRLVHPDTGDVLHEDNRTGIGIPAAGQQSLRFDWTVASGTPSGALAIAVLRAGPCEESLAVATLAVGDRPPGPGGPVQSIPLGGPAVLLLLGLALPWMARRRLVQDKARSCEQRQDSKEHTEGTPWQP
ncbi:carboxypeptidase regulatory-like domain-containing protein [Delftia acidovorans]|uniref:carboxypeptidase regulatory-like domain-containing protein n=1 Tax=Delftia acidovorans TaxID=80866 RepID=UPI00301B33D5